MQQVWGLFGDGGAEEARQGLPEKIRIQRSTALLGSIRSRAAPELKGRPGDVPGRVSPCLLSPLSLRSLSW